MSSQPNTIHFGSHPSQKKTRAQRLNKKIVSYIVQYKVMVSRDPPRYSVSATIDPEVSGYSSLLHTFNEYLPNESSMSAHVL